MDDSPAEKIEYVFDTDKFMATIRARYHAATGKNGALRDLSDFIGSDASTLSRFDNGKVPDIATLMKACSSLDIDPGQFFRRLVWRLSE